MHWKELTYTARVSLCLIKPGEMQVSSWLFHSITLAPTSSTTGGKRGFIHIYSVWAVVIPMSMPCVVQISKY